MLCFFFFFFFKQKTAYEMRISDWSSDVCSSDLEDELLGGGAPWLALAQRRAGAERKHEKNRGRGARDAHRQGLRRWRDAGDSNRWIVVLSGPPAPIPRKTHPCHESANRPGERAAGSNRELEWKIGRAHV